MPSARRWSISAVTSVKVASTRQVFCRRRSGRLPGTRVPTMPDPFATSIAAAYATTCVLSWATSAPSPPCPRTPVPSTLPFAAIAASLSSYAGRNEAARGTARGKPNLIGVLEATVPSPQDRPQHQTVLRARSTKHETASRAARRHDPARRPFTAPPRESRQPRLDSPAITRHPGTGHGAGRRTGSTPVASNAGP